MTTKAMLSKLIDSFFLLERVLQTSDESTASTGVIIKGAEAINNQCTSCKT